MCGITCAFDLKEESANLRPHLLEMSKKQNYSINYVSSFETEFKINTFFRLKEKNIVESLRSKNLLSKNDSPQEVFLALRELRNSW